MTPADIQRLKEILPTSLGSDELRSSVSADILRRSIFSARMASVPYLTRVRELCAAISAGKINQAEARKEMLSLLEQMGHSPSDDGGIKNPAAIRRLNLIIDTNRQMAASVSRLMTQTEGTINAYPAWELTRLVDKAAPRPDWMARWHLAGRACGFEGALHDRFIALKTSPIWAELGSGGGVFRDTLGNPYPPFAYNSGMAWVAVDRDTCVRLGLITADERLNLGDAPKAELSPTDREISDAAARSGFSIKDLEAALQ